MTANRYCKPAPGSFLSLLANDMRLNWRRFWDMLGGRPNRLTLALLAAGVGVMHLVAWPVVLLLAPQIRAPGAAHPGLVALVVSGATWMIAQSLFGTTRALYDRGDLDLLLGSPLPVRRVFAAKAASIAAGALGSLAFLVLPLANVGALVDGPSWLTIYPLLLALALIAAALGLGLSIGLFFLVGPRRARLYTQMTGAVIGGAFVLAAQVIAILPVPLRDAASAWLQTGAPRAALSLPVEAARGDAGAAVCLLAFGAIAFAIAVLMLGPRFARASLAAAGAPSDAGHGARSRRGAVFRNGLARSLRRKEWRLLARDPGLFAQLGLQIVYTIPVAVVLLRSDSLPTVLALAPTIVVVAAQVAASLAWITVSGEDAPELIASAPVAPSAVDRAKLSAVALPVLVIVAGPLAGLALASWKAALITGVFAAAGAASTALLNFWHPMPGNRRGMLRRHSQSKLVGLIEHGLAILWAIAIVFALIGSWMTLVPVAMVAGVLAAARGRHLPVEQRTMRSRRSSATVTNVVAASQ